MGKDLGEYRHRDSLKVSFAVSRVFVRAVKGATERARERNPSAAL